MNTCVLSSVVILTQKKNAPAITFGMTESGMKTATLKVGEEVFDPTYPEKKRFNNYFLDARGVMAERLEKMNLKAGSYVNCTCRMDLARTVLERQASSVKPEDPSYGRIRFVKGLKLELLDISYAGMFIQGAVQEELEEKANKAVIKPAKEPIPEPTSSLPQVTTINLDECNVLTRKRRRFFDD